jgi:hypothetical protein
MSASGWLFEHLLLPHWSNFEGIRANKRLDAAYSCSIAPLPGGLLGISELPV